MIECKADALEIKSRERIRLPSLSDTAEGIWFTRPIFITHFLAAPEVSRTGALIENPPGPRSGAHDNESAPKFEATHYGHVLKPHANLRALWRSRERCL